MTRTLSIPSGIDAIPLSSIPEQWDRIWFQRFIQQQLALMDIRNAVAGTGIEITDPNGNPPTATLGAKITATGSGSSIPGLSVEGNAGTSTGPAAPITATGPTQFLQTDTAGTAVSWGAAPGAATQLRGATWTGGGAPIIPLNAVDVPVLVPQDSTVTRVTVLTKGGTGNCQIDIWTTPVGSYPPTASNSICGGNLPTITGGIDHDDSTLTSWNTNIPSGNVLMFHLVSSTVFTEITITLALQPANTVASAGYTNAQAVAAVAAALANTGNVDFTFSGGAISANTAGASANNWSDSFASNGYQVLPSVLILQWGTYTKASASTSPVTTNFPIAFPNACLNVVVSQTGNANNGYIERVASMGLTSFTTNIDTFDAAKNPSTTVWWRAIGY